MHHDSDPRRRPVYLDAVRTGAIPPGYAVDDGAALIFRDASLQEVVSARENARAYEVTATRERALPARVISRARTASTSPAVAELRRLRLAHLAD